MLDSALKIESNVDWTLDMETTLAGGKQVWGTEIVSQPVIPLFNEHLLTMTGPGIVLNSEV